MIIHYATLPVLAFFAILLAIQITRKRRSHTIDHLIYAEQNKSRPNRRPHAGEKLNIFPHFFHTCGKKYAFQCFYRNKNAFISTFCEDIKATKNEKMPQTGFEPVHGYPYNDLNVARLPVPPLGHLYLLYVALSNNNI